MARLDLTRPVTAVDRVMARIECPPVHEVLKSRPLSSLNISGLEFQWSASRTSQHVAEPIGERETTWMRHARIIERIFNVTVIILVLAFLPVACDALSTPTGPYFRRDATAAVKAVNAEIPPGTPFPDTKTIMESTA